MGIRSWLFVAISASVFACTKPTVSAGSSDSGASSANAPTASSSMDAGASSPPDASSNDAATAPPVFTGNDWPSLVVLTDTANAVRDALVARDMHRLAGFVHPTRGVRFSPYAYIDTKADVVLHASEIEPAFASSAKRTWGSFDGSGEPIVLTFRAYIARFVAFAELAHLAPLNGTVAWGNTINNQRDVYGSSPYVEYYSPGKNGGTDWEALRIVFAPVNGKLYVVGIVHDVWTI